MLLRTTLSGISEVAVELNLIPYIKKKRFIELHLTAMQGAAGIV